jgi:hypothetical protein
MAWPNTTMGVTPLTCPSCTVDALVMQPIRCASARVYATTRGLADASAFARLWPNATSVVAAVAALPEGGAYAINWADTTNVLTGANIWLLNWFNLTLPIEARLPAAAAQLAAAAASMHVCARAHQATRPRRGAPCCRYQSALTSCARRMRCGTAAA